MRSNIANACVPRLDDAECERSLCYNLMFRTMDGTCNNFRQPLRGAAYRPLVLEPIECIHRFSYTRLMSPQYDNGLSEPVSSIRNIRPSPREISRAVLSTPKSVALNDFNMMLMQFGQVLQSTSCLIQVHNLVHCPRPFKNNVSSVSQVQRVPKHSSKHFIHITIKWLQGRCMADVHPKPRPQSRLQTRHVHSR